MTDVHQIDDELQRRKRHGRSKVSNGSQYLPNVDGRSVLGRRMRDIARAIQIEQGGDDIPEARWQHVRRFGGVAALAEQLDARIARGDEINISEYALLVSTQVRIGSKIGIDRVPKDVATLDDYLVQGDD